MASASTSASTIRIGPAFMHLLASFLVVAQTLALALLLRRLLPGRRRPPPVAPAEPRGGTTVSVIVATLNEVHRLGPCLAGLAAQAEPLLEVLVVDSHSTDGTRALVEDVAARDPRFHLVTDPPLPPGWIGKVWALQTGLQRARGDWVLGIDADTEPKAGMVAAIVGAMDAGRYDVASFGPRFAGQSPLERWVQPAMLATLVYRCGAAGAEPPAPDRVLANGQCFIARRGLLEQHGGYAAARASFADDVSLARHLAQRGARVGFLDGSDIISVRAYNSARQMWREWGRSFDLKDATPLLRRWHDVAFVWLAMALPVPVLAAIGLRALMQHPIHVSRDTLPYALLLGVNCALLALRVLVLVAVRGSYAERGLTFWLSWLADFPAAVRLTLSMARRPTVWRGRSYQPG